MKTVIILGMHRSGTSCLAGSLQDKGLWLGNVHENNPFNKKGNRENVRIMEINNSVLSHNNGSWDNPPETITWNLNHVKERDAIIDDFNKSSENNWGFKDPRTLLTLPFWLDRIKQPLFVATFRNPENVALSLAKRDYITFEHSINLWKIYNNILLNYYDQYKFPIISFEVSKMEYLQRINRVAKLFDLPLNNIKTSEIFFDESLRNCINRMTYKLIDEEAILIYNRLLSIYENQKY